MFFPYVSILLQNPLQDFTFHLKSIGFVKDWICIQKKTGKQR